MIDKTGAANSSYISNHPDGYSFNTESDYWLDIEEFERLCLQARNDMEENTEQARKLFSQALKLYQSDYLPELPYCEWTLATRNYYHWLFVDNSISYIKLLEKDGCYTDIISTCEHVFEIENLEENIHLKYIQALFLQNKINQARKHYSYAVSLFQKELNINPFPSFLNLATEKKSRDSYSFKMSTQTDMSEILTSLQVGFAKKGPLFCSPEVFSLLYNLLRDRSDQNSTILASLSLRDEAQMLPEKLEKLTRVIKEELKPEHIITHWNHNNYLLLFPNLNYADAEQILNNILSQLNNLYNLTTPEIEHTLMTI
ncbi:MAG: bacterial transcriptional activator domain-containing protein [Halanaerobiaceae bacterium]